MTFEKTMILASFKAVWRKKESGRWLCITVLKSPYRPLLITLLSDSHNLLLALPRCTGTQI